MTQQSPTEERYRRILNSLRTVFAPDSDAEIEFGTDVEITEWRYSASTIELPSDIEKELEAELRGSEEFRIVVDLFSHLIFCLESENWAETKTYASDFDKVPNVAALVHRLVEESHLTSKRLAQYRGLFGAYETRMEYTFSDDQFPSVAELPHDIALVEGCRQLGRIDNVNGLQGAPDDVRGTLVWVAGKFEQARETSDASERTIIATEIVDVLVDQFDRPLTADRYIAQEVDLQFTELPELERNTVPERTGRTVREKVPVLFVLLIGFPVVLAYLTPLEDELDMFYERIPEPPTDTLRLLVMDVLLPVALLWIFLRRLLQLLGYWERLVEWLASLGSPLQNSYTSRARELLGNVRDGIDDRLGRITSQALSGITAALTEAYHTGAQQVCQLRSRFGPEWDEAIPDDVDPSQLSRMANDDQPETREKANNGGETNDEQEKVDNELLRHAPAITTSGEVNVEIIDEEIPTAIESDLDQFLRELRGHDRKTDSELHSRLRDRDKRLDSISPVHDIDSVLATVRDRKLVEQIRRLLERFPPEETRERRGRTGHRLDLETVARTDAGRLGDRDNLFYRNRRTKTGDRCIGVAIDLSRSMDILEAKVALAALGKATSLFHDNFVAIGFESDELPLVTGPNEQFQEEHVNAIKGGGATPLADGTREIRQLVRSANEDDRLVFVVTDGGANRSLTGVESDDPVQDAAAQVECTRREGIEVIGIGVGTISSLKMQTIFGEDGYVTVDDGALADRLISIYQDQLRQTLRV